MTKSNFFDGLFLSSRVLSGTFASIFVNCQAVSFSPHAWFGVCSFFDHYLGDAYNYGKFKISVVIPK